MANVENEAHTGVISSNTSVTDLEKLQVQEGQVHYAALDPNPATKLSRMRKLHIIIAGFTCTFNCNLGSTMPAGAMTAIADHFSVTERNHLVLLNSLYMAGFVLGPLLFGPLSEYVGRRPVMVGTFIGYLVFMLASSAATNYPMLLAFRVLCGINAAAPTTVIGGLYADIFDDPGERGNAIAIYMTVTNVGPCVAPIISAYSSMIGWRWPFWIAGMIAALGLPFVLTMPETYAPVLRYKAAKKLQKEMGQTEVVAGQPAQGEIFVARKIFIRPLKMLFTQPIVASTSAYLTLAYGLMYLAFQAYPVIFQDFYGLSPQIASLAFIPMAVGNFLSLWVFMAYTRYHERESSRGAEWTKREIYRRLPLACIGAPWLAIAQFWLGWTAWRYISPVVPSLQGFFFTFGSQVLFMGMLNFMTDVYKQSSASVLAAASMTRSIGAVVLPLATERMYGDLGVHWAPSVLGFICLAMGVIPFIFIRFGDQLARASKTT